MKRQSTLSLAIETHQAGRFAEAASLYRNLLLADPQNAEGLHLFGVLMHQIGQPQTAVELIARAIQISPFQASYHLNLGNALLAGKDKDGAVHSYRQATACDPCCVDAHINLGNIALAEKRYGDAALNYGRAATADPKCRDALVLLGVACLENGETEQAGQALDSALEIDPVSSIAQMFRGCVQARTGDYAGGLAFFREAVRLDPLRDDAHNHLGAAYEVLGRYAEAADEFARALALKPSSVEYLFNVGLNMARRKDKGGISCLERAIVLDADHADAHTTLGEMLLAFGEPERGWQEYEWRWRKPEFAARKRSFHQPLWDGQPLEGRTILLHAEQGYGDTIQFSRFIPEVVRRGGRIVLEVQEGLQCLLGSVPGVIQCLRQGIDPLPHFDCHCPLMSLPLLLGTCSAVPPPIRVPQLAGFQPPSQSGLIRVGLVWEGNPKHVRDRIRSMQLKALAPLREMRGIVFTGLQKVVVEGDRDAVRGFPMSCPLMPDDDFMVTARIIASLDVLITVDTAVAHLAGSMGKPVWLLLPEVPDWRWGIEGERSPGTPA